MAVGKGHISGTAGSGSGFVAAVLCGGAAPGQSCVTAALPSCQELPLSQEPSPAQHKDQPKASLFLAPLGSLQVSLGLQGNLL